MATMKLSRKLATINMVVAAAILAALIPPPASAGTVGEYIVPWTFAFNNATKTAKLLQDFDIAVMIDSSKSMSYDYRPCDIPQSEVNEDVYLQKPVNNSRWRWCTNHTADFTQQSVDALAKGPRITVFGDKALPCEDVSGKDAIMKIFGNWKPKGGTFAARALEREFNRYFERRRYEGWEKHPLLIAIITDGSFSDKYSSRRAIINATKKMNRSDEICIVILKIGEDPKAPKFLNELDTGLVSNHNAKFDIVEVKSFDELKDRGIGPVLADVVREKRSAVTVCK